MIARSMPPGTLKDQVAVVTGGMSGIGKACSDAFAGAGATVVVLDIIDGADVICDVTNADEVTGACRSVLAKHGRVDVLMNVVGGATLSDVIETDLDQWEAQLRLNLTSAYLMCRALLPAMIEHQAGSIVSTSSGWGFRPAPGRAAYAAAKAGLLAFTRSLAAEVAPHHVRVNVVAAGPTDTPRMRALTSGDELAEQAQAAVPLGRLARPEDIASAALFLASDAAGHITGQVLHVNGGLFMP